MSEAEVRPPVRRWEEIAQEWVLVLPDTVDGHGTVEARYPDGKTRRVGTWILSRYEQ